jgi:hypothetical protein
MVLSQSGQNPVCMWWNIFIILRGKRSSHIQDRCGTNTGSDTVTVTVTVAVTITVTDYLF